MTNYAKGGAGPKNSLGSSIPARPGLPQGAYFQLIHQGAALLVVKVPPEKVKSTPGPVLTRKQLEEALHRHSIPTVPGSALSGYLNSLHALPDFESHASEAFSRDPGGRPLSRSGWRGALGEISAQRGGLIPQRNLNEVHHNHPIFDLRDYRGGLNSVKTSVRSANTRGDPFRTYLQGLKDVVGLRAGTYALAREALYPDLPVAEGEALMMRNGYVSVNEDHVEPFRAALRDPENYRRRDYRDIADRLLELEPVRVAGTVHRRYQTLESTVRGTGTSEAVRQQIEAALASLRERIASRVRGNGVSTQHLVHLEAFRQQVAAANPQMAPEELQGWAFPELILVAKHGGGIRGNATASGIAGARGAYGGAVVSVVFELGLIAYGRMCGEAQPTGGIRLVKAGIAGGASGLAGGVTQNLVTANVGGYLSRSLVGQGMGSRMATSLGRGVGGWAAGGLAAPVFVMTSLALDDDPHGSTDYAAAGTRAFVSGSLSSAVAAGAVGALWGTEVPVLGNAVGFIIGFAGYYVVDTLMGDRVEGAVRHTLERE